VFRRFCILLIVLSAVRTAQAQYDPSFSHYWAMETAFNPAAAGKQSLLNVAAAYNMTLAGFEHNPRTMFISGDMPFYALRNYHGVGLQILNDDIGLFSHKRVAAQYAYRLKLFGGWLGIGVQGALLSESFDGSELDTEQDNDRAFSTSKVDGTGIDLGAGVYYTHGQWYVGASAQHLNAPRVELGETNEINLSQTYYLTGGYNIRLRNPFLTIHTSALGRTDGVAWRADLTGRLKYTNDQKVMYAGLSYSPGNSVTVLIGGNFHGITLGYSYEAYTSAINIGNGSHELFVGYQTDINLYKKGRNRHQSVRIL
jgi:type IX secretion system PorP/SprF family membrane protein